MTFTYTIRGLYRAYSFLTHFDNSSLLETTAHKEVIINSSPQVRPQVAEMERNVSGSALEAIKVIGNKSPVQDNEPQCSGTRI